MNRWACGFYLWTEIRPAFSHQIGRYWRLCLPLIFGGLGAGMQVVPSTLKADPLLVPSWSPKSRINNFSFLGSSKRFQRSKKSPGVFKAECSRTLFAGKKERDQSQTKSMKKKKNWPEAQSPKASFKYRKVGVSVRTTWLQPITILLNFCWHCYFFMEKHHIFLWKIPIPLVEKPSITFCACAKIGICAELHVDQLLFTLLCFFLRRCSPCVLITGS